MVRRELLRAGLSSVIAASARSGSAALTPLARHKDAAVPQVMSLYSREDHRRRLENIAQSERSIRACMRKHLITNYLPGQVCYNLGEYPCRKPWNPDDWDERELDRLQAQGIRLVQVMEEWNDLLRLFGGDKFSSINPAGLHRFIEMVHKRGMRILLYASTGFFQRTDPDFRAEWARSGNVFRGAHWNMALCSPASPGWRAYLLPRLCRILDDYGVDGLYNDLGYRPIFNDPSLPTKDEVLAFKEDTDQDGALGDLLSLIYSEIKRRGGIYKVHISRTRRPKADKVYDYLWVGESVRDPGRMRETVKDYPPYVVPCFVYRYAEVSDKDMAYVQSIPYMQFPLLVAGRPFTGERAAIPNVNYPPDSQDPTGRRWREMWRHYQTHPEGPHSYGPWDPFPGRPGTRDTHAHWLRQYLPLVQEGTWAYLDVKDSSLLVSPLPEQVVMSVFANTQLYLVLANYSGRPVSVTTTNSYFEVTARPSTPERAWTVKPGSMVILKR